MKPFHAESLFAEVIGVMTLNARRSMQGRRAAIVTGGGTGLGRATAEVLVRAEIDCLIVARRSAPLEGLAASLEDAPGSVDTFIADVTIPSDRERMVEACVKRFGGVDVLVNNAAISSSAPILEFSEDSWKPVLETNVEACFFLAQQVIPDMRSRNWGRIINIGSVYGSLAMNNAYYGAFLPAASPGDRGPVRTSAYHASKAAILGVTRDLAAAVGRWGITVNTISPGMILTENTARSLSDDSRRRIEEMTPLGRFANPLEIGYVVRFLASDEAAFITGAEIVADGGWSIW